jgi:hypothetical protein
MLHRGATYPPTVVTSGPALARHSVTSAKRSHRTGRSACGPRRVQRDHQAHRVGRDIADLGERERSRGVATSFGPTGAGGLLSSVGDGLRPDVVQQFNLVPAPGSDSRCRDQPRTDRASRGVVHPGRGSLIRRRRPCPQGDGKALALILLVETVCRDLKLAVKLPVRAALPSPSWMLLLPMP